jgi:hypothetical protein
MAAGAAVAGNSEASDPCHGRDDPGHDTGRIGYFQPVIGHSTFDTAASSGQTVT